MRFKNVSALGLSISLAIVGGAAVAGPFDRDHAYADNFGNLVIESAAGYKRIVVGEGHQAKQLSRFTNSGQPKIVYADESDGGAEEGCYRAPYLIKGRSYMYGFDEGEIPFQGGPCR